MRNPKAKSFIRTTIWAIFTAVVVFIIGEKIPDKHNDKDWDWDFDKDYSSYLEKGKKFFELKNYDSAIYYLSEIYKDDTAAARMLAISYKQIGDYDNLYYVCLHLEDYYPDFDSLNLYLGLCNYVDKDYPTASDYFEKAIDDLPNSGLPLIYYALNEYKYELKYQDEPDKELIENYIQKALQKDPDNWEVNFYAGLLYYYLDKVRKSVYYFKQVNKLYKNKSTAYFNLGYIYYYYYQNFDSSAYYFRKAVLTDTTYESAFYYLMESYKYNIRTKQHLFDSAEYYIKKYPDIDVLYYYRGWKELVNKKYEDAIADLTKATNSEYMPADGWYALSLAWYSMNNEDLAKQYLDSFFYYADTTSPVYDDAEKFYKKMYK